MLISNMELLPDDVWSNTWGWCRGVRYAPSMSGATSWPG